MATRTVRLDDEAEAALREIRRGNDAPISDVLKRGLRILRDQVRHGGDKTPYEVFRALDSGPGGDAIAASTEVRAGVASALRRKHKR